MNRLCKTKWYISLAKKQTAAHAETQPMTDKSHKLNGKKNVSITFVFKDKKIFLSAFLSEQRTDYTPTFVKFHATSVIMFIVGQFTNQRNQQAGFEAGTTLVLAPIPTN